MAKLTAESPTSVEYETLVAIERNPWLGRIALVLNVAAIILLGIYAKFFADSNSNLSVPIGRASIFSLMAGFICSVVALARQSSRTRLAWIALIIAALAFLPLVALTESL